MKATLSFFCCFLLFAGCRPVTGLKSEILKAQRDVQNQRYAQAALRYEDVLEKSLSKETQVQVLFELSNLYTLYLGRPHEAISKLEKIISVSHDPSWHIQVKEKLGDLYFVFLKDWKNAQKIYAELASFRPRPRGYKEYRLRFALCFLELGDLERAKKEFSLIAKEEQKSNFGQQAKYQLGVIELVQKNFEKSEKYFREYLAEAQRGQKSIEVSFLLANTLESLERFSEAYDLYYSILGRYPNTEVVKNRLKSLYKRKTARKR